MKSIKAKLLIPVLMIFTTMSISAQINSGQGYMHGTYQKGDTGSKYEYDADKAKKADGADTILLKRKATPASEAKAVAKADARAKGQVQAAGDQKDKDTVAEAPVDKTSTTVSSDTSTAATTNTAATNDCDCKSSNLMYGGLGFIIGTALGLLVMGLMKRKREENENPKRTV
ncbi:MAG: hypothetical protein JWO03_2447 [Bacteroidetes bacterium]|nr:hypothetical protein [Bacteroidota bacterium]